MGAVDELSDSQVLWRLVNVTAYQDPKKVGGHVLVQAFLNLQRDLQERLLRLSLQDNGPLHGSLLASVNLYADGVWPAWLPEAVQHHTISTSPHPSELGLYPDWIWKAIAQSPELRERASRAKAVYHEEWKDWAFEGASGMNPTPEGLAADTLQQLAWWPYFVHTQGHIALPLQEFIKELRTRSQP